MLCGLSMLVPGNAQPCVPCRLSMRVPAKCTTLCRLQTYHAILSAPCTAGLEVPMLYKVVAVLSDLDVSLPPCPPVIWRVQLAKLPALAMPMQTHQLTTCGFHTRHMTALHMACAHNVSNENNFYHISTTMRQSLCVALLGHTWFRGSGKCKCRSGRVLGSG